MESWIPGVVGYHLGGLVSPESVDASHPFDFHLDVYSFHW